MAFSVEKQPVAQDAFVFGPNLFSNVQAGNIFNRDEELQALHPQFAERKLSRQSYSGGRNSSIGPSCAHPITEIRELMQLIDGA